MLENGKRLDLTTEEGNALVGISSMFHLPEKLDKDNTYSVADRSIAADEVRLLFRELRSHSPLMQGEEKVNRFGAKDAWKEVKDGAGNIGRKLIKPSGVVSIRLDEDILSGIVWCLLVALHPASALIQATQMQEDCFWPIAKKLSRTRVIREMIGITPTAQPKRWKTDEEYNPSSPMSSDSKS
jgi:hypothetical protein